MTIQLTDEELDARLRGLLKLHVGKEQAIKRWDLVIAVFGVGSDLPRTDANSYDRQIRDGVERLRNHGVLILNLNDGRGRYVSASEDEYWEWRNIFVKQVRSIAGTIRAMDRFAEHAYPNLLQPALFNLDEVTRVLE